MPLVFIVDDDIFFRNYISSILTMNGFNNIESFSSGERCIENINKLPDVIVLDHDMVGMSGTEVLTYLKNKNNKTPVIMVSGRDDEELIADVLSLGVRKYFKKDGDLFRNLKNYFKENYTAELRMT